MTQKRIILAGLTMYPTSIDEEDVRVALGPLRMLDGTLRMYHRGFKKKWTLTWTSVPETSADVTSIRTAYRTTSSQTFNDVNNTNYTVVTTTKTENLAADRISRNGTMYFDITLTIEEV